MNPEDAFASLSGTWDDVRTRPQGNWAIPQDAQIAPRHDLFAKAQDYIYGSEPGRRLMGAVDMWNSLTGGAQGTLGNIAPGAQMAVTPALENLVGRGTISKVSDLLAPSGGYFMDRMADIYKIGDLLSPTALDHPDVLEMLGRNLKDLYQPGGMARAIDDLNLMRIRSVPTGTNIQMTKFPSNAQMEQIMALAEQKPKTPISLDLHDVSGKQSSLGKYFTNPSEAIDAIYKFFGK